MILVDTSVWVDHLRAGDDQLIKLLNANQVIIHPFVIGELACGNLRNRDATLSLLRDLPKAPVAEDDEVLLFIEQHRLMGRGIGLVDAHLLAATRLFPSARLWTRDRRLQIVGAALGLNHDSA